ncbi:MAG: bifunctional hydroxymethylpyrimidine kinase/phosphomethylpyrimidine kinase [Gemmatimonadota bacterium]|nr:MAG: bifunctional hydroxymethylpyrimidine kinase/phosphomethylpyrimidine kinase [Gemmatimonadota bacterium]
MKIALTIAGSDSGGGAGIQADLKTFHQFGVFGTSVLVAITAQNTLGVTAVHAIPQETVAAQIDAIAADLPPDAFKTGMLATAELAELVAAAVRQHGFRNYVLDPVMVATSGDRLLDPDAERTVRETLVPLATVVTPNLDEAAILVESAVSSVASMEEAGRTLVGLGANAALIKGGHLPGRELIDVLVTADGTRHFEHARIETTSTHGTGCTLSSGIAAGLALGKELPAAVRDALDFVHRAIAAAPGLGAGHGPLNHFVASPEQG